LGELERRRDPLEHGGRDLNVTSLLEPRVPGDADTGEGRDVLPPQSRSAPAIRRRQTDVRGRDSRTATLQELAELPLSGIHRSSITRNNGAARANARDGTRCALTRGEIESRPRGDVNVGDAVRLHKAGAGANSNS